MARWQEEPREESWLTAVIQWALYIFAAAVLFIAITAVDQPVAR